MDNVGAVTVPTIVAANHPATSAINVNHITNNNNSNSHPPANANNPHPHILHSAHSNSNNNGSGSGSANSSSLINSSLIISNNNSSSSSSSSSSASSGYGSTSATPTNSYETHTAATTPVAIAEPIIPTATVAAVSPYYSESLTTHALEGQHYGGQHQHQQQHHHHQQQQQQQQQQHHLNPNQQHQLQSNVQHPPQRQHYYPPTYEYQQQSQHLQQQQSTHLQQQQPTTHLPLAYNMGSGSPALDVASSHISGDAAAGPAPALAPYQAMGQYKSTDMSSLNYERNHPLRSAGATVPAPTHNYQQSIQQQIPNETSNKIANQPQVLQQQQPYLSANSSSSKSRSTTSLLGSSSSTSAATTKPQAAATPFYAQPLTQQSNNTSSFYDNLKTKMPLDYHDNFVNFPNAAAYHQQQKYYAAAKSQLKEASTYAHPPPGLTGKSLYPNANTYFPGASGQHAGSGAYDKYMYPTSYPSLAYETPPDPAYRKGNTTSSLNSHSWPWGIDYASGNSRTIPPPSGHIPTATVAPTHASYLTAANTSHLTRDPYYVTHDKYGMKYDKYPAHYQQPAYVSPSAARHHLWPGSERLPPPPPPHGLHSSHYYPANAPTALNARQSCCTQSYQPQSCYYPPARLPPHGQATAMAQPSAYMAAGQTAAAPPPPPHQNHLNPLSSSCKYGSVIDYGAASKLKNPNDLYLSAHYDAQPSAVQPPAPPPHLTHSHTYNYGSTAPAANQPYNPNQLHHIAQPAGPLITHESLSTTPNFTNDLSVTSNTFDSYLHHDPSHINPQVLGVPPPLPPTNNGPSATGYGQVNSSKRALLDYRKPSSVHHSQPIPQPSAPSEQCYGQVQNVSTSSASTSGSLYQSTDLLNTPETTTFAEYDAPAQATGYAAGEDSVDDAGKPSAESIKNLSLRDFIANWNDDEDDYAATEEMAFDQTTVINDVLKASSAQEEVAMPQPAAEMEVVQPAVASMETENVPQPVSKVNEIACPTTPGADVDASQYVNLPDIVIDIEKSNATTTTATTATSNASEVVDKTSLLLDNFDVEKELDQLQQRKNESDCIVVKPNHDIQPTKGNDIKQVHEASPRLKETIEPCKTSPMLCDDLRLEQNKNSSVLTTRPTAADHAHTPLILSQHSPRDIEGYESGNSHNSNESSLFEKEYETFINKITAIKPSSKSESEFEEKVKEFSKFYKRKRKLRVEDEVKSTATTTGDDGKKLKSSEAEKVNSSNFPQVYTKKSRNRQSTLRQRLKLSQLRKRKSPLSMYYKLIHSLRRYRRYRSKKVRDYFAETKEKHLPLIKRQSIKNYSLAESGSASLSLLNPQPLKSLVLSIINSDDYRERLMLLPEVPECVEVEEKHICTDPTCETCEVIRSLMEPEEFASCVATPVENVDEQVPCAGEMLCMPDQGIELGAQPCDEVLSQTESVVKQEEHLKTDHLSRESGPYTCRDIVNKGLDQLIEQEGATQFESLALPISCIVSNDQPGNQEQEGDFEVQDLSLPHNKCGLSSVVTGLSPSIINKNPVEQHSVIHMASTMTSTNQCDLKVLRDEEIANFECPVNSARDLDGYSESEDSKIREGQTNNVSNISPETASVIQKTPVLSADVETAVPSADTESILKLPDVECPEIKDIQLVNPNMECKKTHNFKEQDAKTELSISDHSMETKIQDLVAPVAVDETLNKSIKIEVDSDSESESDSDSGSSECDSNCSCTSCSSSDSSDDDEKDQGDVKTETEVKVHSNKEAIKRKSPIDDSDSCVKVSRLNQEVDARNSTKEIPPSNSDKNEQEDNATLNGDREGECISSKTRDNSTSLSVPCDVQNSVPHAEVIKSPVESGIKVKICKRLSETRESQTGSESSETENDSDVDNSGSESETESESNKIRTENCKQNNQEDDIKSALDLPSPDRKTTYDTEDESTNMCRTDVAKFLPNESQIEQNNALEKISITHEEQLNVPQTLGSPEKGLEVAQRVSFTDCQETSKEGVINVLEQKLSPKSNQELEAENSPINVPEITSKDKQHPEKFTEELQITKNLPANASAVNKDMPMNSYTPDFNDSEPLDYSRSREDKTEKKAEPKIEEVVDISQDSSASEISQTEVSQSAPARPRIILSIKRTPELVDSTKDASSSLESDAEKYVYTTKFKSYNFTKDLSEDSQSSRGTENEESEPEDAEECTDMCGGKISPAVELEKMQSKCEINFTNSIQLFAKENSLSSRDFNNLNLSEIDEKMGDLFPQSSFSRAKSPAFDTVDESLISSKAVTVDESLISSKSVAMSHEDLSISNRSTQCLQHSKDCLTPSEAQCAEEPILEKVPCLKLSDLIEREKSSRNNALPGNSLSGNVLDSFPNTTMRQEIEPGTPNIMAREVDDDEQSCKSTGSEDFICNEALPKQWNGNDEHIKNVISLSEDENHQLGSEGKSIPDACENLPCPATFQQDPERCSQDTASHCEEVHENFSMEEDDKLQQYKDFPDTNSKNHPLPLPDTQVEAEDYSSSSAASEVEDDEDNQNLPKFQCDNNFPSTSTSNRVSVISYSHSNTSDIHSNRNSPSRTSDTTLDSYEESIISSLENSIRQVDSDSNAGENVESEENDAAPLNFHSIFGNLEKLLGVEGDQGIVPKGSHYLPSAETRLVNLEVRGSCNNDTITTFEMNSEKSLQAETATLESLSSCSDMETSEEVSPVSLAKENQIPEACHSKQTLGITSVIVKSNSPQPLENKTTFEKCESSVTATNLVELCNPGSSLSAENLHGTPDENVVNPLPTAEGTSPQNKSILNEEQTNVAQCQQSDDTEEFSGQSTDEDMELNVSTAAKENELRLTEEEYSESELSNAEENDLAEPTNSEEQEELRTISKINLVLPDPQPSKESRTTEVDSEQSEKDLEDKLGPVIKPLEKTTDKSLHIPQCKAPFSPMENENSFEEKAVTLADGPNMEIPLPSTPTPNVSSLEYIEDPKPLVEEDSTYEKDVNDIVSETLDIQEVSNILQDKSRELLAIHKEQSPSPSNTMESVEPEEENKTTGQNSELSDIENGCTTPSSNHSEHTESLDEDQSSILSTQSEYVSPADNKTDEPIQAVKHLDLPEAENCTPSQLTSTSKEFEYSETQNTFENSQSDTQSETSEVEKVDSCDLPSDTSDVEEVEAKKDPMIENTPVQQSSSPAHLADHKTSELKEVDMQQQHLLQSDSFEMEKLGSSEDISQSQVVHTDEMNSCLESEEAVSPSVETRTDIDTSREKDLHSAQSSTVSTEHQKLWDTEEDHEEEEGEKLGSSEEISHSQVVDAKEINPCLKSEETVSSCLEPRTELDVDKEKDLRLAQSPPASPEHRMLWDSEEDHEEEEGEKLGSSEEISHYQVVDAEEINPCLKSEETVSSCLETRTELDVEKEKDLRSAQSPPASPEHRKLWDSEEDHEEVVVRQELPETPIILEDTIIISRPTDTFHIIPNVTDEANDNNSNTHAGSVYSKNSNEYLNKDARTQEVPLVDMTKHEERLDISNDNECNHDEQDIVDTSSDSQEELGQGDVVQEEEMCREALISEKSSPMSSMAENNLSEPTESERQHCASDELQGTKVTSQEIPKCEILPENDATEDDLLDYPRFGRFKNYHSRNLSNHNESKSYDVSAPRSPQAEPQPKVCGKMTQDLREELEEASASSGSESLDDEPHVTFTDKTEALSEEISKLDAPQSIPNESVATDPIMPQPDIENLVELPAPLKELPIQPQFEEVLEAENPSLTDNTEKELQISSPTKPSVDDDQSLHSLNQAKTELTNLETDSANKLEERLESSCPHDIQTSDSQAELQSPTLPVLEIAKPTDLETISGTQTEDNMEADSALLIVSDVAQVALESKTILSPDTSKLVTDLFEEESTNATSLDVPNVYLSFRNQSSFEDESGDFHGFEDQHEEERIRREIESLNEDSAANDAFVYAGLGDKNSNHSGSMSSDLNELEALEKELTQHHFVNAGGYIAHMADEDAETDEQLVSVSNVSISTNDIEHIKKMLESDEEHGDTEELKEEESRDTKQKESLSLSSTCKIPKLSDLCRAALNSSLIVQTTVQSSEGDTQALETTTPVANACVVERELSVEEALAEMYRQAGVLLSDPEDTDNEKSVANEEAQDVLLINLQEILNSDNENVYVLQCDMNVNVPIEHTDNDDEHKLQDVGENTNEIVSENVNVNTVQLIGILNTDCETQEIHIISSDSESEVIILSDCDTDAEFQCEEFSARPPPPPPATTSMALRTTSVSSLLSSSRDYIPFIDDLETNDDSESDLSTIHHEEIVPDNLNKYLKEEFYRYLHEKYAQKKISKYYHANRILRKYKKRYANKCRL